MKIEGIEVPDTLLVLADQLNTLIMHVEPATARKILLERVAVGICELCGTLTHGRSCYCWRDE